MAAAGGGHAGMLQWVFENDNDDDEEESDDEDEDYDDYEDFDEHAFTPLPDGHVLPAMNKTSMVKYQRALLHWNQRLRTNPVVAGPKPTAPPGVPRYAAFRNAQGQIFYYLGGEGIGHPLAQSRIARHQPQYASRQLPDSAPPGLYEWAGYKWINLRRYDEWEEESPPDTTDTPPAATDDD